MEEIKILLASNDFDVYELLEKQLIPTGYTLIIAPDGLSTYEECVEGDFDIILIHDSLSYMNNFDVAELVKSHYPDLPVVSISADEIPDGYKEYFDAFYPNQTDFSELIEFIREKFNC